MNEHLNILRKKEIIQKLGITRSTLYRWIADNIFPKPVQLGPRSVGWIEAEIDKWLLEKSAERFD